MKSVRIWGRLGLKYRELSIVSDYVKERIEVSKLTLNNYISTENMISNKQGVTIANKLPSVKTTIAYKKNDILISNIRPYFKKIWYAENDGGCSNDVLVIRAKEETDSKFLYYVLADDNFFQYSTLTSKGTKMPRGDKMAIMKYMVPELTLKKQKEIGLFLSLIDMKIQENYKINHHLVA